MKLNKAGCEKTSANSGKRSKYTPDKPHPRSGIKKARKGEANYLPNIPTSAVRPEDVKTSLKEEMKKVRKNREVIRDLMSSTFAYRRKQIIGKDALSFEQIKIEWPALLLSSEVIAICIIISLVYVWMYIYK